MFDTLEPEHRRPIKFFKTENPGKVIWVRVTGLKKKFLFFFQQNKNGKLTENFIRLHC